MTDHERPSAFTDSPEDMMAKARVLIDGGTLPPAAALLLSDLARELGKSRQSHASRISMATAAYAERQSMETELRSLREENKAMKSHALRLALYANRMTKATAILVFFYVLLLAAALVLRHRCAG